MSTSICLWKRLLCCGALGVVLSLVVAASGLAQDAGTGLSPAGFEPEIPASYSGSGSFFNRKLGTALRFNYRTEGYGVQQGIVSIGAMKVVSVADGETWFFDGQGTMSDGFGGGFNTGLGYRVLSNTGLSFDPLRIHGVGFWADGQSTEADNFFTQLGFSLESLGDSVDLRVNGQFPLDRTQEGDPVLSSINAVSYIGNNIFAGLQDVTIDTAHSVIDAELAKRIHNLEAWAYIAGYQFGGGDIDETGGFRAGVRGYALPDLALSLQVTDDDVYHTNVMFGITWFVGRTHRGNAPCGNIYDRFREPVLRNNFVATTSRVVSRTAGDALTDSETTETMRIVHVDSNAAAGGDGTFENPFNLLADADGVGSMENDKILVHSGSVFNGADGVFLAQNGQDILGEGADINGNAITHSVGTVELGLITLPETSAGASVGMTPIINGAATAFTLANDNQVNNFVVNGGTSAVLANASANVNLANLDINAPGGNAIELIDVTGTTLIENTVVIDDAVGTALFIQGGEDGMSIAAEINDSRSRALVIENRLGGTIAYSGAITDNVDADGTFGDGILLDNNASSIINLTGAIRLDTDDATAVSITGNSGAAGTETTIAFSDLIATSAAADTVDIRGGGTVNINDVNGTSAITNTGTGDAVHITGALASENNATISIAADITNNVGGNSVEIRDRTANNVTISGNISDSLEGILIEDNSGGINNFTGEVRIDTTTGNAFTMTNNEGATVTLSDVQISTTGATALEVNGGGTLTITDPNSTNTIEARGNGSTAVHIDGDAGPATGDATVSIDAAISSTAATTGRTVDIQNLTSNGVTFNGTVTDEGSGLNISNNSGGDILFNETVSSMGGGVGINISSNTGGTTVFTNTVTVETTGANNGINLLTNTGTTLSFNGLDITTTGSGTGFNATGGGNLVVTSPAGTNSITTTAGTGIGLNLIDMTIDAAGVTFDTINVDGAANGITLTNLDGAGQLAIGGGSNAGDGGTLKTTDTALIVNDVDNLLVTNLTINNSDLGDGAGLNVLGQDGGTVTFTGLNVTTTDTDTAVLVDINTGGTISFNDLTATSDDGNVVTLLNNTGATISFNGMDLVTATGGTGSGFVASGGGTLIATGTNNIDTTAGTGTGLNLDGITIDASGASFTKVDVDGATNGIVLNNATGGRIRVGAAVATGNPGDGGTLTTTGTAIMVTGVSDAVFNDVTVAADANAVVVSHTLNTQSDIVFDNLNLTTTGAGDQGIIVTDNGTGELDVVLRNSNIDTSAANAVAFELIAGNNTGEIDVSLLDNEITSGAATAISVDLDMGTGDVQFLLTGNNITNSSAANATANFRVAANRTLNATIGDQAGDAPHDTNVFGNSNAGGTAVALTTDDALARLNLDLRDNLASGGAVDFILTETLGQFGVVDRTETITNETNNNGTVDIGGGGVEADFDDLVAPIKQVD